MAAMTPLKGSPSAIESQAASLKAAAENMSEASDQLGNLASFSGYSSAAIKQVADDAADVRKAVQKAEVRYRGAGKHLGEWATDLDMVQKEANEAISQWKSVDVDGPAAAVSQARDDRNAHFPLTDEWHEANKAVKAKKALLHGAQEDQGNAEARYRAAETERDELARKHARLIEKNNEISGLNDSLADKIKHAASKIPWDTILDVLKIVADIVSVVATILGVLLIWTPFGGPLLLIGRIAAVVSAAVSLVQLLRGKITFGEFLVAVVLAAGFGLAKVAKLTKFGKIIKKFAGGNPLTKAVTKVFKKAKTEGTFEKQRRLREVISRNLKAEKITPERAEHLRKVLDNSMMKDVFDVPVRRMGETTSDYVERIASDRLKDAAESLVIDAGHTVAEYGINVKADDLFGGHEIDLSNMSVVPESESGPAMPNMPDLGINVMPGADGVIPSIDINIPTEASESSRASLEIKGHGMKREIPLESSPSGSKGGG